MALLHDEDKIGLVYQVRRALDVGIRAEPRGGDIQVGAAREDLLGSRASEPVAAAKGEDAAHAGR